MSTNINTIATANKIEMLKHSIDRYDHYFDSINNKGNLFLTLNTFLLGGIITGYYSIKDNINGEIDVIFFVWIALILCLLSIGTTLLAIIPYISKQADCVSGSVLNFNNVANISLGSLKLMYENLTEDKKYEDYLEQSHLLAKGLQKKFSYLKIATCLLGGCFNCIIIIGIKIFN
jgi:hypothetical protein